MSDDSIRPGGPPAHLPSARCASAPELGRRMATTPPMRGTPAACDRAPMATRQSRAPVDAERTRTSVPGSPAERWSKLVAIARRYGIQRQDIDDVVQRRPPRTSCAPFPGPDHRDYASAYAARCVERRALKRRRRIARKEAPLSPLPKVNQPVAKARASPVPRWPNPDTVDPATSASIARSCSCFGAPARATSRTARCSDRPAGRRRRDGRDMPLARGRARAASEADRQGNRRTRLAPRQHSDL